MKTIRFKSLMAREQKSGSVNLIHCLIFVMITLGLYILMFMFENNSSSPITYGSTFSFLFIILLAIAPCLFTNAEGSTSEENDPFYSVKYIIVIPAMCFLSVLVLNFILSIFTGKGGATFTEQITEQMFRSDLIMIFLILQPACFAGRIIYREHPLAKSLLLGSMATLCYFLIMSVIADRFIPEGYSFGVRNLLSFSPHYTFPLERNGLITLTLLNYLLPFGWAATIWIKGVKASKKNHSIEL